VQDYLVTLDRLRLKNVEKYFILSGRVWWFKVKIKGNHWHNFSSCSSEEPKHAAALTL